MLSTNASPTFVVAACSRAISFFARLIIRDTHSQIRIKQIKVKNPILVFTPNIPTNRKKDIEMPETAKSILIAE